MAALLRPTLLALTAAGIGVVMAVVYVWLMQSQDDQPLAWVLALMVGGAGLAAYGALQNARRPRLALVLAAVALGGLGVLALLSIGMPLILAALLCLLAATQRAGTVDGQADRRPVEPTGDRK